MTENRIKESLVTAVENNTPDILCDLMAELGIKDERKELMHDILAAEAAHEAVQEDRWASGMSAKKGGRTAWLKAAAGCVAALLIVTAGISLSSAGKALAIISLDVNPGIEMSIDRNERVLNAEAVNEEAEKILADMDLKGSNIDVACNAIVGSMLTHGYLSELSNSILLSVSAEDQQLGAELEKRLSGDLNSYLENTEVAAAILGQVVNADETIQTYANEHGISLGKAWLIQNLMKTGSTKMTEADLLSLSTQDLILLGQKRGVESGVSYGEAESGGYIGNEKALAIALEKAGVNRSDASEMRYELDCENGVVIYEVSFRAGDHEYDCDINARDGSIVSFEKEYEPVVTAPPSSQTGGSSAAAQPSSKAGGSSSAVQPASKAGSPNAAASSSSKAPAYYYDDDDDDDYDDDDDDDYSSGRGRDDDDDRDDRDDDDDDDDDDD